MWKDPQYNVLTTDIAHCYTPFNLIIILFNQNISYCPI